MSIEIKRPAKVLLALVGFGVLYGGYTVASDRGWTTEAAKLIARVVPEAGIARSVVPQKAELPKLGESAPAVAVNIVPVADHISTTLATVHSTHFRGGVWEWNAQTNLILANGGPDTTRDSLMDKHGVSLTLYRQDDTDVMGQDLIKCAKQIHDGAKECTTGANFVIIMGDGAGQFAAGVDAELIGSASLKREGLGPDYALVVIGATGYSRGEDAWMAPPNVKLDPKNALGLLISGVLRDGDWNIAMKWAADNALKNNPDEHTWDPHALNWANSKTYNDAAADYNARKCENRQVVDEGVPSTVACSEDKDHNLVPDEHGSRKCDTVHVCVGATVTWTPGDVTIVHPPGRGGLVKVVSSAEYRSQMPAVIIGPKKFFEDNRREVTEMLAATFEAGDQIKTSDKALRQASEASERLYNDKDADASYWHTYFKGADESDQFGNKVHLGGSAVNNLADNYQLFGLFPGTNDNFRSTYSTFASIVMQQYPEKFKDTPIPDVKQIEDVTYITAAKALMADSSAPADVPTYTQPTASAAVVSKRSYNINFDTGKATLTQAGVKQLFSLKDNYAVSEGLVIKIDGHTDNTGDEQKTNLPLSIARAQAVKNFLQQRAPSTFPDDRFAVAGHGSTEPVKPNDTPAGRAANRRVQISLLNTTTN